MRRRGRWGRLIAIEGIDGAGKTTFSKALARALRAQGHRVALLHEPADPQLGAVAQSAGADDPWTGAVYFTVDRFLARPRLRAARRTHDVVLSDRSFYSTLAYQGSALAPRDRARLERLQREASERPDRVLLLDLPVAEALRRLGVRSGGRRGPLERLATLRRVMTAYRRLARRPGWVVLDARRPPPVLVAAAQAALRLAPPPARRRARRRR